MYKFVIYLLIVVFSMITFSLQIDEEVSMNTLFRIKHGLNRATHAAASQFDEQKLAYGVLAIDPQQAEEMAYEYLQANLQLDANNTPLPGSFLESPIEVLVLDILNDDLIFPYHYKNEQYNYEVILYRPGVVMIVRAHYPRIYHVIGPITWIVKGAAELYPISYR